MRRPWTRPQRGLARIHQSRDRPWRLLWRRLRSEVAVALARADWGSAGPIAQAYALMGAPARQRLRPPLTAVDQAQSSPAPSPLKVARASYRCKLIALPWPLRSGKPDGGRIAASRRLRMSHEGHVPIVAQGGSCRCLVSRRLDRHACRSEAVQPTPLLSGCNLDLFPVGISSHRELNVMKEPGLKSAIAMLLPRMSLSRGTCGGGHSHIMVNDRRCV